MKGVSNAAYRGYVVIDQIPDSREQLDRERNPVKSATGREDIRCMVGFLEYSKPSGFSSACLIERFSSLIKIPDTAPG